jgi:hypothetical protein
MWFKLNSTGIKAERVKPKAKSRRRCRMLPTRGTGFREGRCAVENDQARFQRALSAGSSETERSSVLGGGSGYARGLLGCVAGPANPVNWAPPDQILPMRCRARFVDPRLLGEPFVTGSANRTMCASEKDWSTPKTRPVGCDARWDGSSRSRALDHEHTHFAPSPIFAPVAALVPARPNIGRLHRSRSGRSHRLGQIRRQLLRERSKIPGLVGDQIELPTRIRRRKLDKLRH